MAKCVILFLVFQSLCFSEVASSRSGILQKIEGSVQVKNADSDDWMPETRVCLDGGEYCGYLRSSGDFVIHNVPPGSYLVEVHSPNYVFDPVRVDISSKNGKIRAQKVNLLKSTAVEHVNYPLKFQMEKRAVFFEKRKSRSLPNMVPPRPMAVEGVEVFLYRPTTDRNVITGLVFWDEMTTAENYTVQVSQGGTLIPNLYVSQYPVTSYIIFQRVEIGTVTYPLVMGETYEVMVFATNSAGDGPPSASVSFTVEESRFYPEQVLVSVEGSGLTVMGERPDINQQLLGSGGGPVVVDAIGRNVYWYSRSDNRIYNQSLTSGPVNAFLPIPADKVVLALAFDWVADELYMLRASNATPPSRMEVLRVSIFTSNLVNVFPNLNELAEADSSFQLLMNPFSGKLYWTETTPTSGTTLKRFDLRDSGLTGGVVLVGEGTRRRRSSRMATLLRQRRQANLGAIGTLSPALTQDPVTGELLLCNNATGDILRCDGNSTQTCMVEVNHATLLIRQSPGRTSVGLPATNIAVSGERVYWSNPDGVFYLNLSTLSGPVGVLTESAPSARILSLSPGQQLIANNQDCLSPRLTFPNERPNILEEMNIITNTTFHMFWEPPPIVLRGCDEEVFSIPPFSYLVHYTDDMFTSAVFRGFTRNTNFLFTGLMPFTDYSFGLRATNEYTLLSFLPPPYVEERINTLEGVPSIPTGLGATVTGTAGVNLTWLATGFADLRGSTATYYLILANGTVITTSTSISLTNSRFLQRGERQAIQLIVGNGALNSSAASITVELWPLVESPVVVEMTNTSFTINITLTQAQDINVNRVGCVYCRGNEADVDEMVMDGSSCSCPFDSMDMNMHDFMSLTEREFPVMFMFDISGLEPHTQYCLQSVGDYGSEVTGGMGRIFTTGSGVPDAPIVTRDMGYIRWSHPADNGDPITEYTVIVRVSGGIEEPIKFPLVPSNTEFNLNNPSLEETTLYDVVVHAENTVGRSPASNMVQFRRPSSSSFPIGEIAGIVVSGVFVIDVILVVIVIICFVQCRPNSKREIRSLSDMNGPDHELSNLRNAEMHSLSVISKTPTHREIHASEGPHEAGHPSPSPSPKASHKGSRSSLSITESQTRQLNEKNPVHEADRRLEANKHSDVLRYIKKIGDIEALIELGQTLGLNRASLTLNKSSPDILPGYLIDGWIRRDYDVLDETGEPTWRSLAKAMKEVGMTGISMDIQADFNFSL